MTLIEAISRFPGFSVKVDVSLAPDRVVVRMDAEELLVSFSTLQVWRHAALKFPGYGK